MGLMRNETGNKDRCLLLFLFFVSLEKEALIPSPISSGRGTLFNVVGDFCVMGAIFLLTVYFSESKSHRGEQRDS